MKRRHLLSVLKQIASENNVKLEAVEGGNHTKVRIGTHLEIVPRHAEITETTAKKIIARTRKVFK